MKPDCLSQADDTGVFDDGQGNWWHNTQPDCHLEGWFTPDELEAIAAHMRKHGGPRQKEPTQ